MNHSINNRLFKSAMTIVAAVAMLVVAFALITTLANPVMVSAQTSDPPHLLITKTLDISQTVSGGSGVINFTMTGAGDPSIITRAVDLALVMDTSRSMLFPVDAQVISQPFATASWEPVYTFTAVYTINDSMKAIHTADAQHLVRFNYLDGPLTIGGTNKVTATGPISVGTWVVEVNRNGGASGLKLELFIPARRLHAAMYAAKLMVDDMADGSQVGVVTFDDLAVLRQPLTSSKPTVIGVLDGLTTGQATYMSAGIDVSHAELITSGRAVSGSLRAMVLMSDGQTTCYAPGACSTTGITKTKSISAALDSARAAVDNGVIIYTIGFGKGADLDTLRQIADISLAQTGKGKFYAVPDAETLRNVYRQIARDLNNIAASFVKIVDVLPAGVAVDTDNLPPGWHITVNPDGTTTAVYSLTQTIQLSETVAYSLPIVVNWQPGMSGTVNLPTSGVTYTNYADVQTHTLFIDTPAQNPVLGAVAGLDVAQHGPDWAAPGHAITYTLFFSNPSTVAVENATLFDDLPPQVAAVINADGGQLSGQTVSWNLGIVPSQSNTLSRTLVVRLAQGLAQGTPVTNTVRVDGQALNGQSIAPMTATHTTAISTPHFLLDFQVDAASAQLGDTLNYTVWLTNDGAIAAADVSITVTLDSRVNFVSANDSPTVQGSAVVWSMPALAVNSPVSRTVAVTVADVVSPADISTAADAASLEGAGASDVALTSLLYPTLLVDKTASAFSVNPGEVFSYTISVGNSGPADAFGVVLTDSLPADLNFVAAGDGGSEQNGLVQWSVGDVLADGQVSRTLWVTANSVASGTLINNTASARSTDGTTAQGAAMVSVYNPAVVFPALAVSKTPSSIGPFAVGDQLQYEIQITNTGYAEATGLVITDPLDSHAAFVFASGAGSYNAQTGVVSWAIASLSPGQSTTRRVTVQFEPVSGQTTIANTAFARAAEGVSASGAAADVTVQAPHLQIRKTAWPSPVGANSPLTYTIVLTNDGSAAATGVFITDTLDPNVSFDSAGDGGGTAGLPGQVVWSVGNLPMGAVISRQVRVTVGNVPSATILSNAVWATAAEGASAGDTAQTTVLNPSLLAPILVVQKMASAPTVAGGGLLTYTISVTNVGSALATTVTLTDALDSRLVFNGVGSGSFALNGSTVVWTIDNLGVGTTVQRTLRVSATSVITDTAVGNTVIATAVDAAAIGDTDTVTVTILAPEPATPHIYLPVIIKMP